MRIGLNLLHALPDTGGAWNYVKNVVAGLAALDHGNRYVCFATRHSACLVPDGPNFELCELGLDAVSRVRRVAFENTALQWLVRRHRVSCLHWFGNTQALLNAVPSVVTLHDLQAFNDGVPYSAVKRAYLRRMIGWTARHADVLAPISEAVAHDVQQRFGVEADRMFVVRVPIAGAFSPASADAVQRLRAERALPERFWLYVSHFYPHKNHERLLEAYAALRRRAPNTWPLVLRGEAMGTDVRRLIDSTRLEGHVILLPPLRDEEMPVLYTAATALVFPSCNEGGGIPVVEAMACGCPVVAASLPAVREFAGDAAAYFDPLDVAAIEAAMARFTDDDERRQRSERGRRRAVAFRPEVGLRGLLEAYARVAR